MGKLGIWYLVFGIWLIGSVCALGITPARTTLDFKSGMSKDVSFEVINSGTQDMKVVFSAQGELADYISLDYSEASILAVESSKVFSYHLNLPELLSPGLHKGEVYVMQLPNGETSDGSQILATLAVVTQIYLYVPYPGKYANAKMYIYGANKGEAVKFVIPVISAGEFDLTEVRANVDVYTKAGEKIDSFNFGPIAISSGARRELTYDWVADVPIGDYVAKASLIYDDGTLSLEEAFSIGSEELELEDISVKDFSLGEIAKLEMLVENKWSASVEDVYIETVIMNDRGGVVSDFKSASYNVDALSKQVFVSYWDTAGVKEGSYETEVSINYGDKVSKKGLTFEVEENSLNVVGLGYVISAEGDGGSDSLVVLLVVVIVLLVLVNLAWFLVLRKKLARK